MFRLSIAFGICVALGLGICSVSAPAAVVAASDSRPTAKEAVRNFCANHGIAVDGLDRIGEEAVSIPPDPQSDLSLLHLLLKDYSYMAVGLQPSAPGSEGLPVRLMITGHNGPGSNPDAVETQMETPRLPPTVVPPSANPLGIQSAQSLLTRQLTTFAGQTYVDPDIATPGAPRDTVPSGQASGSVGGGAAPANPQMAALTRVAAQQLRSLVRALNRVEGTNH